MDDLVDYFGAYLIGCIPTGYFLLKYFKGTDLRKKGSGHYGMAGVWKRAGTLWGSLTFSLDVLKGGTAVSLAHILSRNDPPDMVVAGFLVLMGDEFPVFLKFKGDRGIGVTVGVFASLLFWMLSK